MKSMGKLKIGVVVTVLVAVGAMVGVTAAFMSGGGQFVSVAQARLSRDDGLHLVGKIDQTTVRDDRIHGKLSFTLIDKDGERMDVVHVGDPVNNLGEAKQVVAIGRVQGGVFVSQKMLLKCPSKYESEESKVGA